MLAPCIAVFIFSLGTGLAVGGTAIFHHESGAQDKKIDTLLVSAIAMIFGMTLIGISALIAFQTWANDPYNQAAVMAGFFLVTAWGVGFIAMGIFVYEAGVMLYHNRTHDQQKFINQQAQAARNR